MKQKKISAIALSSLLVFASLPLPVLAEENTGEETATEDTAASGQYAAKDEVIYGNLDANGKTNEMYVVNTFHVTEPGKIVDYGDYTSVRNLSNLSEMEQTETNEVKFEAEEGEFYYQGNMEKQALPWKIDITYLLDGKEVKPEELPGKDGSLEMQISTSQNENVDPAFFESYMLQISVTLDPNHFDAIQAPDGVEANAGKDKQIAFTVMPEKEEELILTAEVTDFEMEPISINATPFSMSIDTPDTSGMTNDLQSLSSGIADINEGVGELNNGISELNDGAASLASGSTEYHNGISELNQSSSELINGSASIRDALANMSASMSGSEGSMDLSGLQSLPGNLREVSGGINEAASGLETLKANYSTAYTNLDNAMAAIPSHNISQTQIQGVYDSGADAAVVDKLVETYSAANTAKETYNNVKEAFSSVTGTLEQVSGSLRSISGNLETMATEIEGSLANMDQMDSLTQLQEGLSSLSSEYEGFHSGLNEYTNGVGELANSYGELDSGIQELANGTSDLDSGASELKNGTQELADETSNLPGSVEAETEAMMEEYEAKDFEPVSFVSDANDKVEVVQFVLQTEAIEKEETEPTTTDVQEEEKGFWDRFLDLFR